MKTSGLQPGGFFMGGKRGTGYLFQLLSSYPGTKNKYLPLIPLKGFPSVVGYRRSRRSPDKKQGGPCPPSALLYFFIVYFIFYILLFLLSSVFLSTLPPVHPSTLLLFYPFTRLLFLRYRTCLSAAAAQSCRVGSYPTRYSIYVSRKMMGEAVKRQPMRILGTMF
jgi:hypothetical protein